MPNAPVVKRRIAASCILNATRISEDKKSTERPRDTLKTAAIAIGSVLNGLKANPIAGKNIGADWNSTVIVVNKPPIQINQTIFILFNFNTPFI